MHRVVAVKVKILGGRACECIQRSGRRRAGSGAGLGVSEPPDRPWPACPQGRHRRDTGLGSVGGAGEVQTALLQDSHDELMARVNKTHVVEDPFDDELNAREDVESTGAGARGGEGSRCRNYRTQNFRLFWPSGAFHPIMWQ